jgi:hypothetical protein
MKDVVGNDAMGPLSGVARHVAAGLQDSATRMAIMRALKSPGQSRAGIDLQACRAGVVSQLLLNGERAGAGAAKAVCDQMQALKGLVLFMDPDRLSAWDGSVIPIVTALARPDSLLAPSFHGYLTASRIVDLSRDNPPAGPMLVVLPYQHRSRGQIGTAQAVPLGTVYPAPRPSSSQSPKQSLRSAP